jgi:Mannosyltransferase (PIG-V)
VVPGAARWSPWKQALQILVVTRVVFFTVAYSASWLLSSGQGPHVEGFFSIWDRWDATLFLRVAAFGYTSPQTDPHATAFFPLFPLLVRGLSDVGLNPVGAGLLISAVASLIAFAYLFRIAEEQVGEGAGRRAVLYLALFPTAVFLAAPYSEALFLAGAIPAFYYARRARWNLVALPAAVAMGARFAGLFLLLGLAVEFLRQGHFSRARLRSAVLTLGVGLAPLAAYSYYLYRVKGDALYYFVDQRAGWGRRLTSPLEAFRATWGTWHGGEPTNWIFAWRIEILAAAVGLGFVVWALMKREWGYAAFMAAMMASVMASSWYFSIPRMLLSLFPIPLLLAGLTRRRGAGHEIILLTLAPLAFLGVIVYTRGAWFF